MSSDPLRLLPNLPHLIRTAAERLRHREDSEHEQATIRIVLGSLITAYVIYHMLGDGGVSRTEILSLAIGGAFFVMAFAIFAAILLQPAPNPVRRLIGAVVDLSTVSTLMCLLGRTATPLYVVLLWVTFGNGFRFGRRYLLFSAVLSAIGFGLVVAFNPYWHRDMPLSLGLMIGLVVLPAYADLLLRKLVAAIDRAERASAAKSQFLANMSHEVRTPLNGILGAVSLARASPSAESPDLQDHLGTIASSAQTLLGLVSNILDAAKLEAGKLEAKHEPLDLHLLIRETTEMFAAQARLKGLSLSLSVDPRVPPHVLGDATYLRQVLMNLLGNAVKFTEEGEVSISVRTGETADREGLELRVDVRDTGIGIPDEAQSRVFERFTQVDETITRRYGGTGLGMAIARELVELMGGKIGLTSEVGVGSRFWFSAPLGRQDPAASPVPATGRAHSRRILAVCSDPELGSTLGDLVEGWHLSFERAGSVAQAIAHLVSSSANASPFDVVLVCAEGLDVGPYEFVRIIEADTGLRATPLVLVTENVGEHAESAVKRGFETVLPLPIEKTALYNALHYAAVRERGEGDGVVRLRAPSALPRAGSPKRLLLAEDNAVNRKVLSQMLHRAGHSVRVVPDGEAALEALQEQQFDAVLLDLHMPGMSGIEVAKAYRFMEPEGTRAPVLALSADAFPETENRCRAAGMVGLITKPVDGGVLLEQVEALPRPSKKQGPREPPIFIAPSEETSADPGGETLVDLPLLREYASLDPGGKWVQELVEVFAREGAAQLKGIEIAARTKDWSSLRQRARELRANAEPLGSRALCLMAAALEKMPPADLEKGALDHVQRLVDVFHTVETALYESLFPPTFRPSASEQTASPAVRR